MSYRISPCGINLPSSLSLTEDDAAVVCDELKRIVEQAVSSKDGRSN